MLGILYCYYHQKYGISLYRWISTIALTVILILAKKTTANFVLHTLSKISIKIEFCLNSSITILFHHKSASPNNHTNGTIKVRDSKTPYTLRWASNDIATEAWRITRFHSWCYLWNHNSEQMAWI